MNILKLIQYSGMKIQKNRYRDTDESLEEQEEIPLEDLPQEIIDAIYNDNNEDKK